MAKMVIFSAVQGQVLLGGKPVAGAMIERKAMWNDKPLTDNTTSAADGRFALPAIERNGSFLDALLPSEPYIDQSIVILHAGKRHQAWVFVKRNYRDNGELQGRAIQMTCRLDTEPERRGKVFGICELQ